MTDPIDGVPHTLRTEREDDQPAIDALHDEVFGPGRFARSAFRLREGVAHDRSLSLVAEIGGRLVGSVILTPIMAGGRPALLLGPLAVATEWSGRGIGKSLVRGALAAARDAGHAVVLLVGDEPYYGPLGFVRLAIGALKMPAPVDPNRILVAALRPGALEGLAGAVTPAR